MKKEAKKSTTKISKKIFLVFLFIAITVGTIVFMVHKPALFSTAVTFDDAEYVANNNLVNSPSIYSMKRFISEVAKPSTVSGYYQPLSMISLMIDAYMGGSVQNPYFFHRTSLILHTCNSVLIGWIIYMLFRNMGISLFTSILFGVHPMTVETISWLGERKTTLSGFFIFLSIITYLLYTKNHKRIYFIFTHILFVLSLLAKPTGLFLPLSLILLDMWPMKRTDFKFSNILKLIIEKIPLLAITAIFSVITYISQSNSGATRSPVAFSFFEHVLRILYTIKFYISNMILPLSLSPHYPIPSPLSLTNTKIVLGALLTLMIMCFSIAYAKKIPSLLLSISSFLILIFPTLGIIGFSNTLGSDKYAYIPVFALLIFLGGSLKYASDYISKKFLAQRKIIYSLAIFTSIVVCSSYSYASLIYTQHWQDTEKLNKYMISLTPDEGLLWSDLGVYFQSKDKLEEAISCYEKAISLSGGSHSLSYMNYGTVLQKQERFPESIEYFKKAISLDPKITYIYYNMGISLEAMGKEDEAVTYYQKSIEINPNDSPIAYDSIGLILLKKGNSKESLRYFEKAIEQDPKFKRAYANYELALKSAGKLRESQEIHKKFMETFGEKSNSYEYIGDILQSQGKSEEAIQAYKMEIENNPNGANLYNTYNKLGIAYVSQKMLDEAISAYQECLVIKPDYKEVYFNIGSAYQIKGDLENSAQSYKTGLKLYPDFISGYKSLGFVLYKMDKKDEALEYYKKYVETDKSNSNVYKTIGVIYREKGMFKEAKEAFGESLKINPDQSDIKVVLAGYANW
jgi:tetratricopeptide (TPR) repeat protein